MTTKIKIIYNQFRMPKICVQISTKDLVSCYKNTYFYSNNCAIEIEILHIKLDFIYGFTH